MNPVVTNLAESEGIMTFTLSGVNVSLANALRRIVLSDIPCVVFRTTPYEECKMEIEVNTSRLNNELIKQRVSCLPIHISDTSFPIENYVVEVDKKNENDIIDYVTTEDFKIKDKNTGKYLSQAATRDIFPPDEITGDFIDIARLRPRLSEDIDGEHLKFTSTLDIGTAKQDGCFNVASTCAYGYTEDPVLVNDKVTQMESEMKAEGVDADTIAFKIKDWKLLKAQTINIPNSFDFTIETVGQFDNMSLVFKASHVMLDKVAAFKKVIQENEGLITQSDTTLPNGFDIKLIGEDYTLGKALEYVLYSRHYDRQSATSDKSLDFCGFRKPHPHIDESLIRLGFKDATDKSTVVAILVEACKALEVTFNSISDYFKKVD
jgi:DNA-directed RNA polymerase subunit L